MTLPSLPKNLLPIIQLEHHCDLCRTGTKCCCASFDVCITEKEVEQIVGVLPLAAKYVPHILDENGEMENMFDEEEDGLFSIDTHEDGLCVFAYHKKGETRCALHSVALDLKVPVKSVKPLVCMLWPLAISDDSNPTVDVDAYAFDFHCNHKQPPKSAKLSPAIQETLQSLWGDEMMNAIELNTAQNHSTRS